MNIITDGLLIAGALFAGTYCYVLGQRLRTLRDLRSGVGGAIVGMTRALEDARRALDEAKATSRDSNQELRDLIARAESVSGQLRILLAATRDLPPVATGDRAHGKAAATAEAAEGASSSAGAAKDAEGSSSAADADRPSTTSLPPPVSDAEDGGSGLRRALGPAPLPVTPRGRRQAAVAAEDEPMPAAADLAAAQG